MQISAIRSSSYMSRKNSVTSAPKNIETSFKGYTHKIDCRYPGHYEHYTPYYIYPDNLQETGTKRSSDEMDEQEKRFYKDTKEMPPKIYIASPNENIQEEVYKNHTHVQRNDLYLSQIKKDCNWEYKNFASNAYLEIEYYKDLQKKRDDAAAKNTEEIENLTKNYNAIAKDDFSPKIKERIEEDFNKKISQLKKEIEIKKQAAIYADENIQRAEKRFEILKGLDELNGQISAKVKEISEIDSQECFRSSYYRRREHLEKIEKLEPMFESKENQIKRLELLEELKDKEKALNKAKAELSALKEELEKERQGVQKWQSVMDKENAQIAKLRNEDIPAIQEKIKAYYPKVEKFYKEYYPEWADI